MPYLIHCYIKDHLTSEDGLRSMLLSRTGPNRFIDSICVPFQEICPFCEAQSLQTLLRERERERERRCLPAPFRTRQLIAMAAVYDWTFVLIVRLCQSKHHEDVAEGEESTLHGTPIQN